MEADWPSVVLPELFKNRVLLGFEGNRTTYLAVCPNERTPKITGRPVAL